MKAFFRWAWLALAFAARAEELTTQAFLSQDALVPGTTFRIAVTVELIKPWHVNANPVNDPNLIPTTLTWQAPPFVTVERTLYPPGRLVKPEWADKPISLYEGRLVIFAEGRVAAHAPLGPVKIEGKLRYQACDDQSCLPPKTVPVVVETAVAATANPLHPELFGTVPSSRSEEPNHIASLIRQYGWLPALFFVFVGGLALNLTPCVYPMITITISYFGGTGGARSVGRAFVTSLVYCAGIVVTYSTLGLLAALTGSLFGALLQNPIVLVVVALLLVGLALSMFGLYEIQPPRFLLERATGLSSKAGFVGVFFLGAMIGIIAAPCLAPFVVALLTFVAQRANPWLGWWLFFVFACGLGLPYVVLGTFSGLLSRLPKSGTWMVWVKRVFGVGLLGVAVWVVSPLWMGGGSGGEGGIVWEPFSRERLREALAAGRPVVIDFSAEWCGPCRKMERTTFRDGRVVEKARGFVMLKADLTRPDSPASEAVRKEFGVLGVPTVVFLGSNGVEHRALRQTEYVSADQFLSLLEKALAPASTNTSSAGTMPEMPASLMKPF